VIFFLFCSPDLPLNAVRVKDFLTPPCYRKTKEAPILGLSEILCYPIISIKVTVAA